MGKEPMTIPNQREQTARAAAEAYADKLFPCTKPCDKYGVCEGCCERLIFDAGREFGRREGRAKGLEEAAGIAEQVAEDYPTDIFTPLERNEKNVTTDRISASMARHTSRRIAQAIRAAVAPAQKPPQT